MEEPGLESRPPSTLSLLFPPAPPTPPDLESQGPQAISALCLGSARHSASSPTGLSLLWSPALRSALVPAGTAKVAPCPLLGREAGPSGQAGPAGPQVWQSPPPQATGAAATGCRPGADDASQTQPDSARMSPSPLPAPPARLGMAASWSPPALDNGRKRRSGRHPGRPPVALREAGKLLCSTPRTPAHHRGPGSPQAVLWGPHGGQAGRGLRGGRRWPSCPGPLPRSPSSRLCWADGQSTGLRAESRTTRTVVLGLTQDAPHSPLIQLPTVLMEHPPKEEPPPSPG